MKKIILFLSFLLVSVTGWGADVVAYTLTCPLSTTNSNYASNYDVSVGGITWRAPGNQYADGDWRLGGKSISNTNRNIYSKTAIADDITKIDIVFGNNSGSITVNSVKFNVYSTASLAAALGNGDVSSNTISYSANTIRTITVPSGKSWKGRYYSLIVNVTVSGSKNKYVALSSIVFYKDDAVTTYTVTYDNNTGTGTLIDASSPYVENSDVTVLVNDGSISKNGYTFDSWNTKSDGTGTEFLGGESFTLTQDTTLYAQWLENISFAENECNVLSETFDDCDKTGGNDGVWSGIGGGTVDLSYEGWLFSHGLKAYQCGRFGTSSAAGSCTTPLINKTSGELILTFRAGAWNSGSEVTTLMLTSTNASLSESSITMVKGAWLSYTVRIYNILDDFTITWAGSGANNRFFLDDICITEPSDFNSIVTWYNDSIIIDKDLFDSLDFNILNVRVLDEVPKSTPIINNNGEIKLPIDLSDKYCSNITVVLSNGTQAFNNQLKVPYIITSNTDASTLTDSECDVVVHDGSILSVDADVSHHDVKLYGGGKLSVHSGSEYTINSLSLRRDNLKTPALSLVGDISLNNLYFDLYIDYTDWYFVCLPDELLVSDTKYADGRTPFFRKDYWIKWYDGEYRALHRSGAWKHAKPDTIFSAGYGFIIGLDDNLKKKEFRFNLNPNILTAEKDDKTVSNLHAWGGNQSELAPNHKGWNMIGNPFLNDVITDLAAPIRVDSLVKVMNGDLWTGQWKLSGSDRGKKCRYGIFPSKEPIDADAGGYKSVVLDDITLNPFTCFFVQIDGENPSVVDGITFTTSSRNAFMAPRRFEEYEEDDELFLRIKVDNWKTGMFISKNFSDKYEPGDDLESRYPIYQNVGGYKLLYSAINDSIIENGVSVNTPEGHLILDPKVNKSAFEYIYVYYNNTWYNLLYEELNVKDSFIIYAKRKQVATGLEVIPTEGIYKFTDGKNVYINRNNKIYSIIGSLYR